MIPTTDPSHQTLTPMLTVREMATRLSLSVTKAYELLRSGSLPHYRIGGAIRISEADFAAFLTSCRQEPDEAEAHPRQPRLKLKHIKL